MWNKKKTQKISCQGARKQGKNNCLRFFVCDETSIKSSRLSNFEAISRARSSAERFFWAHKSHCVSKRVAERGRKLPPRKRSLGTLRIIAQHWTLFIVCRRENFKPFQSRRSRAKAVIVCLWKLTLRQTFINAVNYSKHKPSPIAMKNWVNTRLARRLNAEKAHIKENCIRQEKQHKTACLQLQNKQISLNCKNRVERNDQVIQTVRT